MEEPHNNISTCFSGAPVPREAIEALQRELVKLPQADNLITQHHFADGMYCRTLWRPAGTLIVGKVHKREHFYIVASGRVLVTTEEGVKELTGTTVVVSKPGTKRAVLALEDSTCLTVHRTDKTDLDAIEEDLIEYDGTALFDAGNRPITKTITNAEA